MNQVNYIIRKKGSVIKFFPESGGLSKSSIIKKALGDE